MPPGVDSECNGEQRDAAVAQQRILEANISALFATAVQEVKRKDRMISELRKA